MSDHWYFRDFSSYNYYLSNYSQTGETRFRRVSFLGNESLGSLNSTVRLTKDWSLYNLTALASYTDDFSSPTNDATLQAYPVVTLTGFRQPLFGSPLQLEFSAAYVHFYRQEGQKGNLWELNPTLYLPIRLGPYVQVTPLAGFRGASGNGPIPRRIPGTNTATAKSFRLAPPSLRNSAGFSLSGAGSVGVEKIRHAIRPEIIYTYIPDVLQEHVPDFLGGLRPRTA